MTTRGSDATPAHPPESPDQQEQHFEVLPIGPDVGLTEVVRAAQHIDRSHPGWRPEAVWSQGAAVVAEAAPGASLARFLEAEQAGTSDCPDEAMLVELIAASERMISHYAAMQSAFIAELLMHREGSLAGVSSVADEISARLAVTPYAGGAAVSRSMNLADSAALRDSLRQGDLSARKVDVITDATMSLGLEEAVAVTDYGVQLAPTHTPPQLKKALAAAVVAADPDRAEDRHCKEVSQRHVRFDPAPDGMAWLTLYTTAEDALAAFTCLDTMAAHTTGEDERGIDARRADAATSIFTSILAAGQLPDGATLPAVHGRRSHVRITATEPVLAADATTPAVLHGYGPITAGTARSLAAEANTDTTVTAAHPISAGGLGTVGRSATRARTRALYSPDPMGELIPAAPPPDHPDTADPGELAHWVRDHPQLTRRSSSQSATLPGPAPPEPTPSAAGPTVDAASAPLNAVSAPFDRGPAALAEALGVVATDAYAPSTRLRALVVARDQTCRFPTCQVPAWRCQLDHIQPFTTRLPAWAQTTETNLHALCTHHHQLKTAGFLIPEREARTGITTWRTRTGHVYARAPEMADYAALSASLQHATEMVVCEPPW